MKAELKLKTLTPEEIAEATGGKLYRYGKCGEVTSVAYDSRDVTAGTLFCAVKGARVDGHDFIPEVVKNGAAAVLAQRIPEGAENFGDYALILVDDTVKALGILSGYYRSFSTAKFIGVTGSVGKTTTKDFIASVLKKKFRTMKTEGNHNNEIGLPMTLFGIGKDCEVAVLEMGMSAFGEISFMSSLAKPDFAVITNIGTSHMATLGSRENICLAKMEIVDGMDESGKLFINADEVLLAGYPGNIRPKRSLVGIYNTAADYKAVNIRVSSDKTVFDILYDGKGAFNVEIPVVGKHNVYNALFAFAAGYECGMTAEEIKAGLLDFEGTAMRQKILPLGKITVIEDCYNAAPESMRAAIDVLVTMANEKGGAPCALLGDMLELGESSRLLHDQIGQYAAQMKVEKLYCYGEMAQSIAEAAIKKGIRAEKVYVSADTSDPAYMAKMIASSVCDGDILLVKASRGIAAERVIAELKNIL